VSLPLHYLLCNRTHPYSVTLLTISAGYFRAKPSPVRIPQQFSNLIILHLPAYENETECFETSAYKIQTPGNYPEENIQQTYCSLLTALLNSFKAFLLDLGCSFVFCNRSDVTNFTHLHCPHMFFHMTVTQQYSSEGFFIYVITPKSHHPYSKVTSHPSPYPKVTSHSSPYPQGHITPFPLSQVHITPLPLPQDHITLFPLSPRSHHTLSLIPRSHHTLPLIPRWHPTLPLIPKSHHPYSKVTSHPFSYSKVTSHPSPYPKVTSHSSPYSISLQF
jgi:hypothetical protein